jgi:hypothetical protein
MYLTEAVLNLVRKPTLSSLLTDKSQFYITDGFRQQGVLRPMQPCHILATIITAALQLELRWTNRFYSLREKHEVESS